MENEKGIELVGSGLTGLMGRLHHLSYSVYAMTMVDAMSQIDNEIAVSKVTTKGYRKAKLNKKQLKVRAASKRAKKTRKRNGR